MKVLAIGNSFSQDATRYLNGIARSGGVSLDVVNLMIGGCSLEQHYQNMVADSKSYSLEFNGGDTGFKTSIREALLSNDWDVITLQQASHFSFDKSTYLPFAKELLTYIRQNVPRARVLLHQTWAYEKGSERLRVVAGYERSEDMLADVVASYGEVCRELGFDGIIPSGEMLGYLTSRGIAVHRDTFHASLGLGRYALGLLWYRCITGKTVAENRFCDLDLPADEDEIGLVKEYVDGVSAVLME